jgi:hypothetical protein
VCFDVLPILVAGQDQQSPKIVKTKISKRTTQGDNQAGWQRAFANIDSN